MATMHASVAVFAAVALVVMAVPCAHAMFESEAGSTDWRKQHVGRVVSADFAERGKYLAVVTDANAVAALNVRTGEIAWRQVLPDSSVPINAMFSTGDAVISVGGDGTRAHRWDAKHGSLMWETALHTTPILPPISTQLPRRLEPEVDVWASEFDTLLVSEDDGEVLAVLSHGEVKVLDVRDGSELWAATLLETGSFHALATKNGKIFAIGLTSQSEGEGAQEMFVQSWDTTSGDAATNYTIPLDFDIKSKSCRVVSHSYVVCLDGNNLRGVGEAGSLEPFQLVGEVSELSLATASSQSSLVVVRSQSGSDVAFKIVDNKLSKVEGLEESTTIALTKFEDNEVVIGVKQSQSSLSKYEFLFVDAESGLPLDVGDQLSVNTDETLAAPVACYAFLFRRTSDQSIGFSIALQTADDAIVSIRKGEIKWKRDESLADIGDAIFVDLPAPTSTYTHQHDVSFPVMAVNRVVGQVKALFARSPSAAGGHLIQDFFNQNKMIVVVTHSGKIFGVLSENGKVVWSFYPGRQTNTAVKYTRVSVVTVRPTTGDNPMVLVLLKSGSGCHSIEINPLTGDVYTSQPLSYNVRLVIPTPVVDVDHARVFAVLDDADKIHVFPSTESAVSALKAHSQPIFMHTVDEVSGVLQGYKLSSSLDVELMWSINFDSEAESIAALATRHQFSRINSIGETLGDRNVIYKYLNPNMIALATMSPYLRGSANLTVYLIDTVKGSIITKVEHLGVYGAVHLTQSANWVVYHFRNRRSKRNEIGILELFDGGDEAPIESFSSFSSAKPVVLRQAYIAPFTVSAMATTFTGEGVTETQILTAMTSGSIAAIHKRVIDARRPTNPKAVKHAEGLMPYHPMLMHSTEKNLNYNLTLAAIRGIYAAPCGLESTTAVLATGLDVFMTLTAPSKRFDTLSEDFPHLLLIASLLGLSSLVFFLKTKGTEKKLQTLWK